ncbi:DUF2510 domain-containing protein [Gordonia sp. ABSL11-1]|uniref:DUF2510 domain-containing protein n=1 Tax=Gordonia sp. ABSL11-1 TaxID=3053924 RepID=UPI002573E8C3|nr:DUF2510 domain-containing protein [Gordonia sp. ABSL11-1]MDL9944158.1 DUF2510 domain-containing protein [Gordonia sp. ABSL11-1]
MTQPHPPGWYPDPQRRELQRYWDGASWTDQTAPRGTTPKDPDLTPADPSAKKKGTRRALIVAGAFAVVVLVVVAVGAVLNQRDQREADEAEASKVSESIQFSIERESRARDVAASAAAASQARAAYESRRRATMLDKSTYSAVSAREWAQIAKDPSNAAGKRITVYGRVTQFDSGTGSTAMRADVGGEPAGPYDYDTNTIVISGEPGVLADVVKDDMVTMWVEVEGSMTYDTTMGGSTTVPKLSAYIVEVTGSAG